MDSFQYLHCMINSDLLTVIHDWIGIVSFKQTFWPVPSGIDASRTNPLLNKMY